MQPSIHVVVAAILASGGAFAQTYKYGEPPPPNPPPSWSEEGRSADSWDRYRYNYSGTRGRMGLGANPAHPEGPGNFSTPGR